MKVFVVVVCIALLSIQSQAKKRRDHGDRRGGHVSAHLIESVDANRLHSSRIHKESRSQKSAGGQENETPTRENPCVGFRCKGGAECSLDENNAPKCVCIRECPDGLTADDAVCGSNNRTYESECILRRTKCLGSTNKSERKKLKKLKISYVGSCKAFTPCRRKELKEYPSRMRVWLKNIFLQMYDTPEEDGGLNEKQRHHGRKVYSERERLQDFEEGFTHELREKEFQKFYSIYKYPIHWKFADLDKKPKDKKLTKKELEPLRAPLIPMEHCTKSFFKMADKNKDKIISLEEWGSALGLKEGDVDPNLVI